MRGGLLSVKWRVGIALILSSLAPVACQGGPPAQIETVTIAVPALEQNALMYVADDQKFFEQNGLKVTLKNYETGVATINALVQGEADIAEAAEFPFVRAVLRGQPVQIIASNDKFENDFMIVRKDRGVNQVADLKGKRIGVTKGTIAEFFLVRFLHLNGIEPENVTAVDVPPHRFASAIESSEVDALVAWEPHINQIMQKQENLLLQWQVQSDQTVFGVLVSNKSWIAGHADVVRRLLKALEEAERYMVRHPVESQAIVRARLDYSPEYLASTWPQHRFSLSLDISLLIAMEDEARWLIANNMTAQKDTPNLRDDVYIDGMKAVKPEAVNFSR